MSKDVQPEPQYDVAISFLSEHHSLALEIKDELADRLKTFVYSREQAELVGRYKDGVDAFTQVFRRDSRVCVVLHSKGWGAKGMTFVEETAMKERALSPGQGWDFLIVVCLDETAPPDWIPKPKIWYGYKEYGLRGLLAAIDIKVTELGGRPKQDSVLERAARMERERAFAERRKVFSQSEDGFRAAQEEITTLYKVLESRVEELTQVSPALGLSFEKNSDHYRSAAATSKAASFVFYWQPAYANSLTNAALLIVEWAGRFIYYAEPRFSKIGSFGATPTLNHADRVVWQLEGQREPFTSEALVDFLFERLLKYQTDLRAKTLGQPNRPPEIGYVDRWRY